MCSLLHNHQVNMNPLLASLDKLNIHITKGNKGKRNNETKNILASLTNSIIKSSSKEWHTHHSKNKSCYVIQGKKKSIVISKVDLFKNLSKKPLFSSSNSHHSKLKLTQNEKKNSLNSICHQPANHKGDKILRSNSISNLDQTTKSTTASTQTTASKRIKEIILKSKSNKINNQYINTSIDIQNNYINNTISNVNQKRIPKLESNNTTFEIKKKLMSNLKKKRKGKNSKNKSVVMKHNKFLSSEKSLSLLSEYSAFNTSKQRSSSNTHNGSSNNNTISLKYSSNNSNSIDKKSKSISVDFTYTEDESLSSRNRCKKILTKDDFKDFGGKTKFDSQSFASFYEEMNRKLFGK